MATLKGAVMERTSQMPTTMPSKVARTMAPMVRFRNPMKFFWPCSYSFLPMASCSSISLLSGARMVV